ncbi:hypothetical protein [Streptomyces soliscabiei]|uniref:hypothetical protein n=1 Tax=Streptomyces soliscabiei TaxID=588897 RepID=UPI0029A3B416|nr:hypothetical protein [Streptomyces sp. NY05-11A]MDX2677011.1 hypothetical protein [Streptomyces sp. NY05-11A]
MKAALDAAYAWCPVPDGVYRRSRIVQEQLTALNMDLLLDKRKYRPTNAADDERGTKADE